MKNEEMNFLSSLNLAPWIQKASRLRSKKRKIYGGVSNQFRHNMETMIILIDHQICDSIVLKASVIHDLLEEFPDENIQLLECLEEGVDVVKLVIEVSKLPFESKEEYLQRLNSSASDKAIVVKAGDRISNLLQLNTTDFSAVYVQKYICETEKYLLPRVKLINNNLHFELVDIIAKLRKIFSLEGLE